MECSELLQEISSNIERGCYVRPAILYGSEAWCLKESDMGILRGTERSMVRAMCGVQLKDRKISTDLMFMLGLKKTMDRLAMTVSVAMVMY